MSVTIRASNTSAAASREPIKGTLLIVPSARFPGLVARVAHWQLIQSTRIKVELPEKAIERQGLPAPEWLTVIRRTLDEVETAEEKLILREWRQHPLREWGLGVRGVGEHSLAVLVGLLDGDPYIAYPKQRIGAKGSSKMVDLEPYARTFGQLRAYCGVGDPDRKRRAGMSQEDALAAGKPLLKSRIRLIAESMLKAGNREGYDAHRTNVAGREDWTDGHKHAHALRVVGKEFLRDLYNESERLHLSGEWR